MAENAADFNFPLQKIHLIDVKLQRILTKNTECGRESIVEEIAEDFEIEFLLEEREKCFTVGRAKLKGVLHL